MITEPTQRAFDRALISEDPLSALRRFVATRLEGGMSRDAVLGELEELRRELRRRHRERDEDVVLDVMDFVSGWASPHMRI